MRRQAELWLDRNQIAAHCCARSQPSEVREVRILEHLPRSSSNRPTTSWGSFDHPEAVISAIRGIGAAHAKGLYLTQNAVDLRLLARASNRLKIGAKSTTADAAIPRIQHLTLDCDSLLLTVSKSTVAVDHVRASWVVLDTVWEGVTS